MTPHVDSVVPVLRIRSLLLVSLLLLGACSHRTGGKEGEPPTGPVAVGSPDTAKQDDETTSSSAELAEAASQNMWKEAEKEGFALTKFIEANSPDGMLFACAREIPNPDLDFIHRRDLDGTCVLVVRQYESPPGSLFSDYEAFTVRHVFPGRSLLHFQWSPDSKFVVFTTASSGGHSPWHCQSYFFCVADQSFRDLAGALRHNITDGDFRIEAPDTVVMTVCTNTDFEHSWPLRASLSELVEKAEPLPDKPSE